MAVAADLQEAAEFTQDNLFTLWLADTLRARCIAFSAAINALSGLGESNDAAHPVTNWAAIIACEAPLVEDFEPDGAGITQVGTFVPFQTMVDYVYRLCKVADHLNTQTPQQITNAQATAILAAYNAQFG